jgi:hypothetical protein
MNGSVSSSSVSSNIRDPSSNRVRVRKPPPSHEYVVPSNFATIPTNNVQKRMMKNAYYHHNRNISNRQRLSLPPSIKEEENEDDDVILDTRRHRHHSYPVAIMDDEDEDIPLAVLAYRKGFVVPDKAENVFPLVQHIPSHQHQPPFLQQNQRSYYRYSDPCLPPNSILHYPPPPSMINYATNNRHPSFSKKEKFMPSFYQLQQNGSYSSSSSSNSSSNSSLSSLGNNRPSSPSSSSSCTNTATRKNFCRQQSFPI